MDAAPPLILVAVVAEVGSKQLVAEAGVEGAFEARLASAPMLCQRSFAWVRASSELCMGPA